MDRVGQPQHRRGFSMGSGGREKTDEDLALFQDMRNRERNHYLYPNTDDQLIDATLSAKFGGLSHSNSASLVARKGLGAELLNSDVDKNDYDWLLTPPGTPLFPSLDLDSPAYGALQQGLLINRSLAAIKTSRGGTTRADPPTKVTRGNPSPGRRPSTPQNGPPNNIRPQSPSAAAPSTRSNRPATPTRSSTPISGARPATPTRQSSTSAGGGRPVTPLGARPATPTRRPATPTNRPSTPSNRPSTPTNRPATPTNRPATPTSGRPSTPTLRRSSSSPTGSRPFGAGSTTRGNPSPTRSTASSGSARGISPVRGNSRGISPARGVSPVSTRGRSPSPRPYPVDASDDIPPNLRTTSDRPTSAQRRAAAYGAGPGETPAAAGIDPSRRRTPSPSPRLLRSYSIASQQNVERSSRASSDSESSFDASSQSGVSSRGLTPERPSYPRRMSTGNDDHGRPSLKPRRSSSSHFGPSSSKKSLDSVAREFQRGPIAAFRPLMTNSSISTFYSTRASGLLRRPLTPGSNASSSEHGASMAHDSEVDEEETGNSWGRLGDRVAGSHSPNILVLDNKSTSVHGSGTLLSEDTNTCDNEEVTSTCRETESLEVTSKERPSFMMADEVHHFKNFEHAGSAKINYPRGGAEATSIMKAESAPECSRSGESSSLIHDDSSKGISDVWDAERRELPHDSWDRENRTSTSVNCSTWGSNSTKNLELPGMKLPVSLVFHGANSCDAGVGGLDSTKMLSPQFEQEEQSLSGLEKVRDKLRHLQSGADNEVEEASEETRSGTESLCAQTAASEPDKLTQNMGQGVLPHVISQSVTMDDKELCGCGHMQHLDGKVCQELGCNCGILKSSDLKVEVSSSTQAVGSIGVESAKPGTGVSRGLDCGREKGIWYMYRNSSDYETPAVGFPEAKMEAPPLILAKEVHMRIVMSPTTHHEVARQEDARTTEIDIPQESSLENDTKSSMKVHKHSQEAEIPIAHTGQQVSCIHKLNKASENTSSQPLEVKMPTQYSGELAKAAEWNSAQKSSLDVMAFSDQLGQRDIKSNSISSEPFSSPMKQAQCSEGRWNVTLRHTQDKADLDAGSGAREDISAAGPNLQHALERSHHAAHGNDSALTLSSCENEASVEVGEKEVAEKEENFQRFSQNCDEEIVHGHKYQQCMQLSITSMPGLSGTKQDHEVRKPTTPKVRIDLDHVGKSDVKEFLSVDSHTAEPDPKAEYRSTRIQPHVVESNTTEKVQQDFRMNNPVPFTHGDKPFMLEHDEGLSPVISDVIKARENDELASHHQCNKVVAGNQIVEYLSPNVQEHTHSGVEEDAFIDIPVDPCGRVTAWSNNPRVVCTQEIEIDGDFSGQHTSMKNPQQCLEPLDPKTDDLSDLQEGLQELEASELLETSQTLKQFNHRDHDPICHQSPLAQQKFEDLSQHIKPSAYQSWNLVKTVDEESPAAEGGKTREWQMEKVCLYPKSMEPTSGGGLGRQNGTGLLSTLSKKFPNLPTRTPTSGSSTELSRSTDTTSSHPSNNSWEDRQFGSRFWDSKSSSETARISDVSEPPPVLTEACSVAVAKNGNEADFVEGESKPLNHVRNCGNTDENRESPNETGDELFDYIFDYLESKRDPSLQPMEAPSIAKMVVPASFIQETPKCDLAVPKPLPNVNSGLSEETNVNVLAEEKAVESLRSIPSKPPSNRAVIKKSSADFELPDSSSFSQQSRMVHSPVKEEIFESSVISPGPNARKHMSSFKFSHKKSPSDTKKNSAVKLVMEGPNRFAEPPSSNKPVSKQSVKSAAVPQLTKGRSVRAASPARLLQDTNLRPAQATLGADNQQAEELSIHSRFSNITVRSGSDSENFKWGRSSLEETSSGSSCSTGANTTSVALLRMSMTPEAKDQIEDGMACMTAGQLPGEELARQQPTALFLRQDPDNLVKTATQPEADTYLPLTPPPNSADGRLLKLSEPDCWNPMEAHTLEPGGWKGYDQRISTDPELTITVRRPLNYPPRQNLDELSEKLERLEKYGTQVLRSPPAQFMCSPSKEARRPGTDGNPPIHPAETVRLGSDQQALEDLKRHNKCRCTIL